MANLGLNFHFWVMGYSLPFKNFVYGLNGLQSLIYFLIYHKNKDEVKCYFKKKKDSNLIVTSPLDSKANCIKISENSKIENFQKEKRAIKLLNAKLSCFYILNIINIGQQLMFLLQMLNTKELLETSKSLYLAGNMTMCFTCQFLFNINFKVSCIIYIFQNLIVTLIFMTSSLYEEQLMHAFSFQFLPVASVFMIFFYIIEREARVRFMQGKQIETLIREQKKVFDLLPEGLVIHSSQVQAQGPSES